MSSLSPKEKALKIKGYCSDKNSIKPFCRTEDGFPVKISVIKNLQDYLNIIDQLESTTTNPMFYHGHANANFLMNPTVLRASVDNENILFKEFQRRFPNEIKNQNTVIEKLAFMQHYGLYTRCLDLSESPLIGLYFAVSDMVKFRTSVDPNKDEWGEVILIRMPENNEDDIKYINSYTASVIASTATVDREFNLFSIEMRFRTDGHQSDEVNLIQFRDIIRRSIIVRTPMNFPRITNQRGAFILVNASEVTRLTEFGDYNKLNNVSPKDFMKFVMDYQSEWENPGIELLKQGYYKEFGDAFKNVTNRDFDLVKFSV